MYERLLKEGEEIGIRKGETLTFQIIKMHKKNPFTEGDSLQVRRILRVGHSHHKRI